MTALKRKCTADKVALSSAFDVDHTLFLDMQLQVRKAICAENVQRSRDTIQWTHKHDEKLHIVMNAISDRAPYVEGSRNKHWWRQVEAGMCSAMQHTITIRTLKHRAKLLDARGVQRTSVGFFESSARGEAAYDGVKAAERAHDEAKAVENVTNLRVTQRLQILATCIDKLDSTMRREIQQYRQLIRSCRDNYIQRLKNTRDTEAMDERVAATTAVDEHTAAMAARASTQEALRAAREHATAQRANTCGMMIPRD